MFFKSVGEKERICNAFNILKSIRKGLVKAKVWHNRYYDNIDGLKAFDADNYEFYHYGILGNHEISDDLNHSKDHMDGFIYGARFYLNKALPNTSLTSISTAFRDGIAVGVVIPTDAYEQNLRQIFKGGKFDHISRKPICEIKEALQNLSLYFEERQD